MLDFAQEFRTVLWTVIDVLYFFALEWRQCSICRWYFEHDMGTVIDSFCFSFPECEQCSISTQILIFPMIGAVFDWKRICHTFDRKEYL